MNSFYISTSSSITVKPLELELSVSVMHLSPIPSIGIDPWWEVWTLSSWPLSQSQKKLKKNQLDSIDAILDLPNQLKCNPTWLILLEPTNQSHKFRIWFDIFKMINKRMGLAQRALPKRTSWFEPDPNRLIATPT